MLSEQDARVYTAGVCVCEHGAARARGHETTEALYRPKTACVSVHTHTSLGRSASLSLPPCIQYNYIQQTKGEINRLCIQSDYTGGGGRGGS